MTILKIIAALVLVCAFVLTFAFIVALVFFAIAGKTHLLEEEDEDGLVHYYKINKDGTKGDEV